MKWHSSDPSRQGRRLASILGLAAMVTAAGCAGPAEHAGVSGQPGAPRQQATLRTISSNEPQNLASKFDETGGRAGTAKRVLNAGLSVIDSRLQPQGVLAEQLPQINTDSWKVLADGRMETTYRLRPGLSWHDGQPLTAEDFVFAWRVYRTSSLPWAGEPQNKMEQVSAPDPRTILIQWSAPEVGAGHLGTEFEPLPTHVMQEPFQALTQGTLTADAFLGLPFWTQAYVSAGPWRLLRWEFGAFIEGIAFDGFALGRPKIDRVVVRPMGDENTILANVLTGELDYTPTLTLRFEHGALLDQDWVPAGRGQYEIGPNYFVMNVYQLRSEFQREPALIDVRARRAMVHAVDRQALADGLFNGQVRATDSWMYRYTPYFAEAERVIAKYPYDPRRAQQLLEEAGLRRGSDGFFVNPDGRRFEPDFQVRAGTQQERGQAIQIDAWRRAGIYVTPSALPNITVPAEERHNVPGFVLRTTRLGDWNYWISSEIGSPANRWRGRNRSGWSTPEFDRLFEAFDRTLDRGEMDRLSVQMLKILHDEVPGYVVYDSPALISYSANLRGPTFPSQGTPSETEFGKLHQWEFIR